MRINEINKGERIDSYLAKNTKHSRANIQRLIDEEKILVNNSKVKVSYKM